MANTPTVSVCLPVYNGERFLTEAIESVLNQTYKDFELLIIDDCSSDGSEELINKFLKRDKRIRYLQNPTNIGLFQNYNECIKRAAGTYIKLFAQDDVFHLSILEKMVEILENKPRVALVSCAKEWISETGELIEATNANSLRTLKPFDTDQYLPGEKTILDSFQRFVNWLGEPCAVMFRKKDAGTGFDTRFRQIGDLEYSYRLLQHGDYYFLKDPLCKFRKHIGSTTNKNGRSLHALLDWFVLGSKYKHYLAKLGETEDEFCARLTRRLIKTIATRFAAQTENNQLEPSVVLQQLTDFPSILSCFTFSEGTSRCEEDEYKVFAISALKEGANLHNEVRYAQNVVEAQQEQIADLKREIADVRKAANEEIQELKAALSEVGNSVSWKVTAPLRNVKKILR